MNNELEIWYEEPAKKWEEALPVGNGRLGAMVMGQVQREVIYLNEDSIWSGKATNRVNKDARKYLDEIRRLIHAGKIPEAEKLSLMALSGTPNSERSYETAGELIIEFEGGNEHEKYRRGLDLKKGCVSISYENKLGEFTREFIASYPDEVMAYHLKAKSGSLNFTCRLDRCHNRLDKVWADNCEIGFMVDSATGIPFVIRVRADATGGQVQTIGEFLVVRDAKEVTLFIDIQTEFYNKNYSDISTKTLDSACKKGWDEIFEKSAADYNDHFNNMSLVLGNSQGGKMCDVATDKRLRALKNGEKDPGLFALYFMYGRYLLFASSRGKSLPANLQGIWNNSITPAWDSKFTININAEMNYWIAESGNLSECHLPFFNFLDRICENGKNTAKQMYGCRGSVAHHNSDIFADTAPQDHYIPASFWVMGEAWMATHIWEHYLYTGDRDFLLKYLKIMDECVDFFEDFLVKNDKGELITTPSVSPENVYIMKDGTRGCLCEGATMDIEILMELLGDYISACKVCGLDDEKIQRAQNILSQLPEIKVGKHGQIQEWMEDYEEQEPGHRHISHLYGVYPGSSISYEKTPDLMKAARITLERRLANGGGHTGWSRAWIIGLWAHFLEGEKAYDNLKALLCQSTFDNLMDNHPYGAGAVFQIDGNFGGAAAILEMLVQGRDDYIKLLPALPKNFSEGSVKGLRLRGGYELSMEWKDMKVTAWDIMNIKSTDEKREITVLVNGEKKSLLV